MAGKTWSKADMAEMSDAEWDALRLEAFRKQAERARLDPLADPRAVDAWQDAADALERGIACTAISRPPKVA